MSRDQQTDMDPTTAAVLRNQLLQQISHDRAARRRQPTTPSPGRVAPWVTTALVTAVLIAITIGVLVVHHGRDDGAAAPAQHVFGGRCAAVLPDGVVGQAVGDPVRSPADQAVALGPGQPTTALDALGGLTCSWTPQQPTRADQAGLLFTVAPAALASLRLEPTYCYASSSGGPTQASCRFSFTTGRLWFSGVLTTTRGSAQTTAERVRLLHVAARAAAGKPGAVTGLTPRPAGSWLGPINCSLLVRRAHLAAALEDPGLVGQPGDGGAETPAAQLAADRRLAVTACIAETDTAGGPHQITAVQFTIYPAAAAVTRDRITGDPSAYRLSAASDPVQVWVTRDDDGYRTVHVLSGPNYLQIDAGRTPIRTLQPVIAPLLQQLDRHRSR